MFGVKALLCKVLEDNSDIIQDSIESNDFSFLVNRLDYTVFVKSIESHIESESDRKSAHDVHRSELWRRAVISATDVKHSDPMSFADKVLSHYDEKFNIK